MNFDKEPCISRDNPGKLILLSGRQFENPFYAVAISFCPCHYEVIWGASASTMRKETSVPLNRTRSLTIPRVPRLNCMMPCASFKSQPSFSTTSPQSLTLALWTFYEVHDPFDRVTHTPVCLLWSLQRGEA